MVKSLKSADSLLLYTETEFQHQHTMGVLILDPSTAPNGFTVDDLLDVSATMVDDAPGYRLKLVDSPLTLNVPMLAEDPDFNLRNHLQHIAVPAPGTLEQLAELVSDFASRPLPRSRPMWENWIVSGLEGGYIAMVSKTHHCLQDGVGGAETMAKMFDLEPDPPPRPAKEKAKKTESAAPTPLNILQEAYKASRERPSLLRTANKTVRGFLKRREAISKLERPELLPPSMSDAPRLFFNGQISAFRSMAMGTVSLSELKALKNAYGVTMNDAIMAIVAVALRKFLQEHDALPEEALACTIPISLALNKVEGVEDSGASNQLDMMNVRFPIQIEDPLELMQTINQCSSAAKELFAQSGENIIMTVIDGMPPRLAATSLGLMSGAMMAKNPLGNLGISNVPGPPIPLYMRGAKVIANYPMGPIPNGVGLGITLMSYVDRMDFTVQGCREKLPDTARLAALMNEALAELLQTMPELSEDDEAGKTGGKKSKGKGKKKTKGKGKSGKKKDSQVKTATKPKAKAASKASSKAKAAPKAKAKARPKAKASPKAKAAPRSRARPAPKTKR